jgi:precorrin-6B C5,15-methyltransferase / cobalt-precorrin-6B C5,C15-methyltransferase
MTVQRLLEASGRADVPVVDAAHGLRPALNLCRARSAVVVKTAPGAGPAELGRGLAGWRRTLIVSDADELSTVDPADAVVRRWTAPTAVLCLADTELRAGTEEWAIDDDAFAHREGHVSSSEVRALALARLAPRPGILVWDVNAASGAVAIECARLGAAVLAVEPDPVQCVRIIANASAHQVDVRVVETELQPADLPKPDSVFVGGGALDDVKACAAVGAQRVVVATTHLGRIIPARDALREAGYDVDGCQLTAARLVDDSFTSATSVAVLWGSKK